MDIDYVVLWVDGNDPVWKKKMLHYKNQGAEQEDAVLEERFRDLDVFKYMFRSLEKNTPWLHKVYLVTDGQCPQWLNRDYDKVEVIDHKQIIDNKYLPVFNSCAIEANIHKIPGLSEHFIYGNDDTFINAPMKEEDFFRNGLPRYFAGQTLLRPTNMTLFTYEIYTDMILIYRNFTDKKAIRKNYFKKLFSPKYGMKMVATNMLLSLFGSSYSKFLDPHVCMPMLKSTYEEIWNKEPEVLNATSSHRFRSHDDVNQYIFRYWNIASGKFEPDRRDSGYYEVSTCNMDQLCQDILNGKNRKICINDGTMTPEETERRKTQLIAAFEKRYPEKSGFEL